jgi:transcriptional regulator with XRE-family HTH domain
MKAREAFPARAEGTTMPNDTAGWRGEKRPQDVDRHVGARLREHRIMLGLTQQQLAERLGTSCQQVHKYERGINRLSAGQLHRIAEALGVGPGYFFEDLGAERPAEPAQRMTLELAHDFTHLPSRRHQEALAGLARALNEG